MRGMNRSGTRIAIVGAGPAGFYAVEALLKGEDPVSLDIFNRLPAPYGLVRDGVAPDHEPIKTVTRAYRRLLARTEVKYFGNVGLGTNLATDDLRSLYDQIVYAFGAQAERRLNIPGEELPGSHAATRFVGWYNGHPDYRHADFNLGTEHVVVVGNGNVAIDVARILVLSPDRLAKTDIADHALDALRKSRVRQVTLLGRRGPAQAAFTNPELREFGRLEGISPVVDGNELRLDPESQSLADGSRIRSRNMNTLSSYARTRAGAEDRVVRFRFLVSPTEILGQEGRVAAVRAERNRLVPKDGSMRPQGTGKFETFPCGLVLRSVGYRVSPVHGVPFDELRGVIPNDQGRVLRDDGKPVPGEYVVGWAKRGPSGVIGTNKADAGETVARMTEDRKAGIATIAANGAKRTGGGRTVEAMLRKRDVRWVDKEGWGRIEAHEIARGTREGRPRVKICTVEEMLEVAGAPRLKG